MKDTLDRADDFKVVLRSDYTMPQDDGGKKPVTKTPCPVQKRRTFAKLALTVSFSRLNCILVFLNLIPIIAICFAACTSVHRDAKQHQDERDGDKTRFDSANRWQPLCNEIGFSGTDLERQKKLRKLTRPFLHDLHTWYSENKPTKSSVTP